MKPVVTNKEYLVAALLIAVTFPLLALYSVILATIVSFAVMPLLYVYGVNKAKKTVPANWETGKKDELGQKVLGVYKGVTVKKMALLAVVYIATIVVTTLTLGL